MHLKFKNDCKVYCPAVAEGIMIEKGETIHTENSHKFTNENITNLALAAGLDIQSTFVDANNWFSIILLSKSSG